MNIIQAHLPKGCFSPRPMESVDGAVVHYISAVNVQPNDPFEVEAIRKILIDHGFSTHYLIDRDGNIYELVPLPMTAYHAGRSRMMGRDRCNNFTVGIELIGGEHFDYTKEEIASCKHLLANLMTEHKFSMDYIQGHNAVRAAWNSKHPNKKTAIKIDPGKHFPWDDIQESLQGVIV